MRLPLLGLALGLALTAPLLAVLDPAALGADWRPEHLAALLVPGSGMPVAPKAHRSPPPANPADKLGNPLEVQSMRAFDLARQGRSAEAVAVAQTVLAQAPAYRPALTLLGLLAAEWTQPLPDADGDQIPARRLQPPGDLTEESAARLTAWQRRDSHRDQIPASLLQVSGQIRTVLAADLAEARLYVFRNDHQGLTLQASYYLSTGARGFFKQNRGDQRTPVGVYGLLPRLAATQLPPLAGHGAWPLSFPNRWDQWQGHLGSGIWLHGSPPGQYDTLPHATNGCLALSNDDLDRLAPTLGAGGAVLLVADRLEWSTPAAVQTRRAQALERLASRVGRHQLPSSGDSLYSYPGAPSLLLVRRDDGKDSAQEEFWPAGALEPIGTVRSASRSSVASGAL